LVKALHARIRAESKASTGWQAEGFQRASAVISQKPETGESGCLRGRREAAFLDCQRHMTPCFTGPEIAQAVLPLQQRLAALEDENAQLKSALAQAGQL
jgi:hypothetical protein